MKNNKKKLLVIVLLLIAMVGVVGYGAYSYYYTQGEFEQGSADSEYSDNVIRITGTFNPTVDLEAPSGATDSGAEFLGRGGEMTLHCPDTVGGLERITCTATVDVRNDGNTGIYVRYYDTSASASSSDAEVYAESPDFRWSGDEYSSSTYLSANSSTTLYISVDVNVGDNEHISSGEAQLVYDPVSSGSLEANVYFSLEATQDRNY